MLKKKLGFLVMLVLVLVSLWMPTTAKLAASCSGDDCGCGLAAQECRESCGPVWACNRTCNQESIRCSIECCGGGGPTDPYDPYEPY